MSNRRNPNIVAHRGASADHLENTIDAFVGAREQGADWVELDVRISADGQLVVHHDAWYSNGLSVSTTAAADRPPHVPLLHEALDACSGMGVNIELKNSPGDLGDPGVTYGMDIADLTVSVVVARRVEQQLLISSFDEATLARVREHRPRLDTGLLTVDLHADPGALDRAAGAGDVAVHPWDLFVDEALMLRCGSLELDVNVWTVDDPDRIRALADLGVAGIITNTPAAARRALAVR